MQELIKKHIGVLSQQPMLSSVEYFVQTGEVSGGFFMALKAMMREYHEQEVVKNLNIPVIKSVCENCQWKNNRHTEPCSQCSNNYGLLFEQTVS